MTMSHIWQNCGVTADIFSDLCNPTSEDLCINFCDNPTSDVCEVHFSSMKYSCDLCGSISADEEFLCNPSEIK